MKVLSVVSICGNLKTLTYHTVSKKKLVLSIICNKQDNKDKKKF